jgi:hypothetical protein
MILPDASTSPDVKDIYNDNTIGIEIMKLFTDDELINGAPKCDGLRRVFGLIRGEIQSVDMELLQAPVLNNVNRATVKCTVVYLCKLTNKIKRVSDLADCSDLNTDKKYAIHPVATAATTAESRVYRKILGIKSVSAEELNAPSDNVSMAMQDGINDSNPCTIAQQNAITNLNKKLGINTTKLLQSMKDKIQNKIDLPSLNYLEAQEVLKQISLYDRGANNNGQTIPDSLFDVI